MTKATAARIAAPSKIQDNWRTKVGVYRLTLEMPLDLWKLLQGAAAREGQKPVRLIRQWLAERLGKKEG